jgi:NADH:ubiquinone oxidoreductase subunit 6 (subunit J)
MSSVLFFIAAIAAIVGAVGVVTLRNPLYAVLALVCHLISLAALFLLLRAEFVAAAQVVVYAGAVMVLYVFVVAYVGGGDEIAAGSSLRIIGPLFALALAIELFIAMLGSALSGISGHGAPYILGFGTPEHIGKLFLTTYLFPFEVASLLLLVAAVGAVVLARRRRGLEEEDVEEMARVLARPRPSYSGTIAEGVGVRKVLEAIEQAHGGALEVMAAQRGGPPGPVAVAAPTAAAPTVAAPVATAEDPADADPAGEGERS